MGGAIPIIYSNRYKCNSDRMFWNVLKKTRKEKRDNGQKIGLVKETDYVNGKFSLSGLEYSEFKIFIIYNFFIYVYDYFNGCTGNNWKFVILVVSFELHS